MGRLLTPPILGADQALLALSPEPVDDGCFAGPEPVDEDSLAAPDLPGSLPDLPDLPDSLPDLPASLPGLPDSLPGLPDSPPDPEPELSPVPVLPDATDAASERSEPFLESLR